MFRAIAPIGTIAKGGIVLALHAPALAVRAMVLSVSLIVLFALAPSTANAQANIHNGSVPLNTDQNANDTASGTLEDRGSVSDSSTVPYRNAQFDMAFSLTGAGGATGAIWQEGIEYREFSGTDVLYVQATRVNRMAGRYPTYDFVFTRPVSDLTFVMGGIDNFDSNRLTFYFNGSPINTSTAWVNNINGNSSNLITASLLSATELEVASQNSNGSSGNLLLNVATITVPSGVFVDRVVINGGKNGSDSVNTLSFFNFDWSDPVIDPNADSGSGVAGVASTPIANVRANDFINGLTPTSSNSTISVVGSLPSGFSLDTTSGAVSIDSSVAAGTYTIDYQLCDTFSPANCNTVTSSVTVDPPEADLSVTKSNGVNEVTSGSTTTYTLTVTHNGGDSVTGALVTDTPVAGITCAPTASVTITGDGVPAGSYTFSDLSGGGIALGTLTSGQAATLTYSCQVN